MINPGLSCLLLFLSIGIHAQEAGFHLDHSTKEISISEKCEWVEDKDNAWFTDGLDACQYLKGYVPYGRNALVLRGFQEPPIVRFTLHTDSLISNEFVLHLRNTGIDRAQLYIIDANGKEQKSKMLGDVFEFGERYFDYRILAFPVTLESNHTYTCYLGLEKKNRIVTTIIELSEKGHWYDTATKLNLAYGLSLGFLFTFLLIALSIYVILWQKLYLYYSLYVLGIFLTLFSIHGLSFQFFYPNNPELQQYFMLLAQYTGFLFGNLYTFEFLKFQHHSKWFNPIKHTLTGIYILGIINTIAHLHLGGGLQDGIDYLFISTKGFNAVFFLGASILYAFKYRSKEAIVFLVAFTVIGITVLYTNLSYMIPSIPYLPIGQSLLLGLDIEAFILTLFLVMNYRSTENDKLRVMHEISIERLKSHTALMQGQEIEKRRISMNIHDNIGSSIVSFRQNLDKIEDAELLNDLKSELGQISKELRSVSHELLPVTLEEIGLVAATRELINRNNTVDFHFNERSPTPNFDQAHSIQIYRILQELIKNSYQHAKAETIHIQFSSEESHFELTYEDDGVGFEKSELKKGLGMKSIESRVHLLKGSFLLESEPGKGLLAIIKVPI